MSPFFLLGLPRSRTKWLSVFLGCGHDLLVQARSFEGFAQQIDHGLCGSVETAGMLGWKLMMQRWPKARLGLIRRSPLHVCQSMARKNWLPDPAELAMRNEVLDVISLAPGVQSWCYEDLSLQDVGREIWQWAHPQLVFDEERFHELCLTNIQLDLAARKSYVFAHGFEFATLKASTLAASAKLGGMVCLGLN